MSVLHIEFRKGREEYYTDRSTEKRWKMELLSRKTMEDVNSLRNKIIINEYSDGNNIYVHGRVEGAGRSK